MKYLKAGYGGRMAFTFPWIGISAAMLFYLGVQARMEMFTHFSTLYCRDLEADFHNLTGISATLLFYLGA